MAKPLAVLIVEDSDSDAQLIVRMLTKTGYTLTYERIETAEQMRDALQKLTWEVVISDFSMPELDGNVALKILQETGLDIPFIVVSGTMGEDTAVAMMKAGAHDYLMKGKLARLVPAVERELQQAEERRERKQAEDKLRESEKRFSAIFHSNPAATALTRTSDNRLIEVSEAWQKLTGYSRSQAVGHTGNELKLWVETKVREQMVETLRQQGKARCETKILCKSGEIRDVLMSAEMIELAGERFLLTMAQDITDRKQAERYIKDIISNNPMSIQVLDKDGFTLETNPAFKKLFGSVPPSGYSIFNDLQLVQKGMGAVFDQLRNGEVIHLPDTKFNPHNSISELPDVPAWVRTIGFPIFDSTDKPVRFILVHEDITERKKTEEALIQANNRLSLAQHSAKAGVWDWDIVTGKLEWSPELLELFGLDTATVPTFDVWRSVLHPEDVQSAGDKIDQAIREHKPLSNEYRIVLPAGEIHWINAIGDTIYGDQGEPQRMTGMCIDITERKQNEQKIQRQFDHLASLSAIDRVVTTNFDLKLILEEILAQTTKELDVDAVDILLLDPVSGMLEFAAKHGFKSKSVNITQLRMGESYAGRAALERKLVHIPDLRSETDTKLLAAIAAGDNFISYFGVPLINKGKVSGVLEVFHRKHLEPDNEWYDFLNSLAGQAAIAIENASLYESQQRTYQELTLAYDATIEGWSHALDLRDKETEGHSLRVTDLTLKLAGAFVLNNDELIQIRWGALLHDIGKMGVPDGILLKPGPLTDEEWVVMRKHPSFAYEMLSPIHYLRQALDIPYSHHEKWDGSGYPQGLKGKQIPLAARIFAVVDVWDALRSDRPYRSAWPDEKAYNHIRSLSGTHFDPQIVEVFLKLL